MNHRLGDAYLKRSRRCTEVGTVIYPTDVGTDAALSVARTVEALGHKPALSRSAALSSAHIRKSESCALLALARSDPSMLRCCPVERSATEFLLALSV